MLLQKYFLDRKIKKIRSAMGDPIDIGQQLVADIVECVIVRELFGDPPAPRQPPYINLTSGIPRSEAGAFSSLCLSLHLGGIGESTFTGFQVNPRVDWSRPNTFDLKELLLWCYRDAEQAYRKDGNTSFYSSLMLCEETVLTCINRYCGSLSPDAARVMLKNIYASKISQHAIYIDGASYEDGRKIFQKEVELPRDFAPFSL